MNDRTPYLTSALCFVAGGIAGAGLSLLMAPQSGKATRRMMTDRLNGGVGSMRQLRDRVVTRGQEAYGEAAHRVENAFAAATYRVDSAVGNAAQRVENVLDDAARRVDNS